MLHKGTKCHFLHKFYFLLPVGDATAMTPYLYADVLRPALLPNTEIWGRLYNVQFLVTTLSCFMANPVSPRQWCWKQASQYIIHHHVLKAFWPKFEVDVFNLLGVVHDSIKYVISCQCLWIALQKFLLSEYEACRGQFCMFMAFWSTCNRWLWWSLIHHAVLLLNQKYHALHAINCLPTVGPVESINVDLAFSKCVVTIVTAHQTLVVLTMMVNHLQLFLIIST